MKMVHLRLKYSSLRAIRRVRKRDDFEACGRIASFGRPPTGLATRRKAWLTRLLLATDCRTTLNAAVVEELRQELRGDLLRQGDDGYEGARRIRNGMIYRRPASIARCAGAADVILSVAFAREHGLVLSVRGGGHTVSGNAVCDGGLMIDLSPDEGRVGRPSAPHRTGRGRLPPGATWTRKRQPSGLATTGGIIPATGIAGLTLGGGLGWLMRKHGLSCANLLSADVVLADGMKADRSTRGRTPICSGVYAAEVEISGSRRPSNIASTPLSRDSRQAYLVYPLAPRPRCSAPIPS